jgi:endonuclease/exonuclease/phosphatase (EEP) superfamily protein YafD
MLPYFRSIQGRLLALAMALPLITGVIVPFNAEGMGYYALPVIVAICLGLFAVGLSLDEYPGAALTGIIVLPVALFLYVLLVGIVAPQVHGVVYAMAIAACILLAIAARPGLPAQPRSDARVPRVA